MPQLSLSTAAVITVAQSTTTASTGPQMGAENAMGKCKEEIKTEQSPSYTAPQQMAHQRAAARPLMVSKSGLWFEAIDAEGATYYYHRDTRYTLLNINNLLCFQGVMLGIARRRGADSAASNAIQQLRCWWESATNGTRPSSCGRWTPKAAHWIQTTSVQRCGQIHWILPQALLPIKQWLCRLLAKSANLFYNYFY